MYIKLPLFLLLTLSCTVQAENQDEHGAADSPTMADMLRNATPYEINSGTGGDDNAGNKLSNANIEREGDVNAGFLDPWAVPSPDSSDSQILEDQMNPDPTLEYDEQLYD